MSGARLLDAATIQRRFREAAGGKNLRLPDLDECEHIAESVTRGASFLGTTTGHTALGEAEIYAKKFLDRLPSARDEIRSLFLSIQDQGVDPKDNRYLDGIIWLDTAETALRGLIERYGGRRPTKYTWHDLANWIAAHVHGVWRDGEKYKAISVDPAGPLCKLVQSVLTDLGIMSARSTGEPLSNDAVSDALRFRRGRNIRKIRAK